MVAERHSLDGETIRWTDHRIGAVLRRDCEHGTGVLLEVQRDHEGVLGPITRFQLTTAQAERIASELRSACRRHEELRFAEAAKSE